MNMNRLKEQKGITLIVLVTIIIILLILAGVSVAMLTGSNGVIENAFKAKSENKIGDDEEQIRASYSAKKMDLMKAANGGDYTVTADALKSQLVNDLHLEDESTLSVTNATSADMPSNKTFEEGMLKVTMPSRNVYLVDNAGHTTLLSGS